MRLLYFSQQLRAGFVNYGFSGIFLCFGAFLTPSNNFGVPKSVLGETQNVFETQKIQLFPIRVLFFFQ